MIVGLVRLYQVKSQFWHSLNGVNPEMTIGAGWYLVHEIFVVFTRITEKAEDVGGLKGKPTH